MILWPLAALVGFLALTALVIAMGTSSTARYEAERQLATDTPAGPAEAVGAVRAA
jgi:NADH:ubiquinone oxidoreductase subunit 6 (subunit J)